MLSFDVALHLEDTPAAVCLFSGVGINQAEWSTMISRRKGMKVFQSHGTADPLLPYQLGLILKEFLEKNAMNITFVNFNDGHTIPPKVIQQFAEFLLKLVKSNL